MREDLDIDVPDRFTVKKGHDGVVGECLMPWLCRWRSGNRAFPMSHFAAPMIVALKTRRS